MLANQAVHAATWALGWNEAAAEWVFGGPADIKQWGE
jgi:hypothetical protein